MAAKPVTTDASASCCPLPPGVAPLPVTSPAGDEERLAQVGRWAHALSDPIRLRMLDLMLKAQGCCRPGGEDDARAPAGVCVCELQSLQGLAQSKVSYHLRVLREAGLVREQRRGRWSFYAVDDDAAGEAADAIRRQLGR